jgi:hypothetical protein
MSSKLFVDFMVTSQYFGGNLGCESVRSMLSHPKPHFFKKLHFMV